MFITTILFHYYLILIFLILIIFHMDSKGFSQAQNIHEGPPGPCMPGPKWAYMGIISLDNEVKGPGVIV